MWYCSQKPFPPQEFRVGDVARTRERVPLYPGRKCIVKSVDDFGIKVEFPDGATMTYDEDDLYVIEHKS